MVLQRSEGKQEEPLVDLGGLGTLEREPSDPVPDLASKFKRGDEVTVTRRMPWLVPGVSGGEAARRDVKEGTPAVVEGWADAENRKLLIKVVMHMGDKP